MSGAVEHKFSQNSRQMDISMCIKVTLAHSSILGRTTLPHSIPWWGTFILRQRKCTHLILVIANHAFQFLPSDWSFCGSSDCKTQLWRTWGLIRSSSPWFQHPQGPQQVILYVVCILWLVQFTEHSLVNNRANYTSSIISFIISLKHFIISSM